MTNNITDLNGSESSDLQVITEGTKSHYLLYKGYKFIYSNPTNGTFIYKCNETRCPMRIKVDKDKREVLGKAGSHDNHSVNTPSPRSNRSNTIPGGKITSTPLAKKDKTSNKSDGNVSAPLTVVQQGAVSQLNKSNNLDAYTTVIDIDQTHLTRGANQTINNEAFKSMINPEMQNSQINDKAIDNVDNNIYKVRYDEMYKLKDSLIEKILEKERVILKQGNEIKDLNNKVSDLEHINMELISGTQIEAMKSELEHANSVSKQLLTTISTLEAGWEVDKKELDMLQKKYQDKEESLSLRPEGMTSPVQPPSCQTKQCKAGPSRIQLSVIGDSHVRRMDTVLASKLPSHFDVKCYFKPGSKVAELNEIRTRNHNHQDIIILFSGTNDVSKTSMKSIKESFMKIIDKNKHCAIGVVLVPLRQNTCNMNTHIKSFNAQLVNFFNDKHVTLIDPTKILCTSDYCNDNLHLNKTGKNKLGQLICDKLTNTDTTQLEKNKNTKTTAKNKHEQRRVNFNDERRDTQHKRYSGVREHNRYRDPNTNYNSGYNNKYNSRYSGHGVNYYNYNRRYDNYHKQRLSYYQHPHFSHYNRTYQNTNRYGRVHHNSGHTRRYHSRGGWDSAREENSGGQNRFFRKY
uniref:Uncharacterized protein n=1 Tax=Cacopsylla melanoneura TaxID=428564 RepID=A0A8D8ZAM5_9HEMI